ncbi:MAG: hypothetical protein ACRYG8_09690 [Janthinobacterium lividum]
MLLEGTERRLRAASEPTTIHAPWVHLANRVDIVLREQDNPFVQPFDHRSFNSQLLEKSISPTGAVRLDFKPEGL